MNARLATTSYESPNYFLPSSPAISSAKQDYRGDPINDFVVKIWRLINRKSGDQGIGQIIGQLASLGISEPVRSSPITVDYSAQLATIARHMAAPANWSIAQAEAPSMEQALVAQSALLAMMFDGIPAPRIMLLDAGTLGGFWRRNGLYASIDFDVDGEFPWSIAEQNAISSGIWSRGKPFPKELRAAIFG